MNLSKDAFNRARQFIETQARPLDVARFRFHFEGGSPEEVVTQLRPFQNPDGGFGHALEPDLRTTQSSALCTTIAFQILQEVGIRSVKDHIPGAIEYLTASYNPDLRTWRIVPPSCDDAPHAPWWTQKGREEFFDRFSLNPTAEILGFLIAHRASVSPELISGLIEVILSHLSTATQIEMHDFLCVLRLAESEEIPREIKDQVLSHLDRFLDTVVNRDPFQWESYVLRPLQVADHPGAYFSSRLKDVLEKNLEYEICRQKKDGSWPPNWSWGEDYPTDWERARVEWSGVLTLEKVLLLKRYERIGV